MYTHLCHEVEQLSHKQGVKLGAQLIKDLPFYPDPCDPQRRVAVPRIHDVTIHGPRTPKQTKYDRYQFCCNQAAVHHLGVPLSQLLRNSGLEVCFDAFRAPVTATFQFEDYIRFLFGCQVNQLAAHNAGQGPSLSAANQIKCAFQRLEQKRTRIALLDCLLAAGCYNGESRWPVGHFVVFREGAQQGIYYLGSEQPKLILLVIDDQYGQPGMWMIGASAYRVPLEGSQAVTKPVETSKIRPFPDPEHNAWIECHDGTLRLNTPLHCSKQGACPACFLAQINEFEYCPMHCSERLNSEHLTHLVCCQDDNAARLAVLGWFAAFSEHTKFWVFHVIQRNDSARVIDIGRTNFVALPQETGIPTPCSNCTHVDSSEGIAHQFNQLLDKWPYDNSRHFLIRTGGDQQQFYHWLQGRSLSTSND